MAVRPCPGCAGASARGLETCVPIPLSQPEDPEARAVALLGMGPIRQDRGHQRPRLLADRRRPIQQARRAPLHVLAVGDGHVIGHRCVASQSHGGHPQQCLTHLSSGRSAGSPLQHEQMCRVGAFVAPRVRGGCSRAAFSPPRWPFEAEGPSGFFSVMPPM